MAIRQVKAEPQFPPAHLYLEDIEEIVSVLADAEKHRRRIRTTGEPEGDVVQFVVANRECDSIDDLKKIGGRWVRFEGRVGLTAFFVKPFGSYVITADIFDRISVIISARESKIKRILQEIPWWGVMLLCFVGSLAMERVSPKQSTLWGYLVPIAIIACTSFATFRHTVVELRYSHEKTRKTETARRWLGHAISIIIGAVLLGVGQLLWSFVLKHIRH